MRAVVSRLRTVARTTGASRRAGAGSMRVATNPLAATSNEPYTRTPLPTATLARPAANRSSNTVVGVVTTGWPNTTSTARATSTLATGPASTLA